MRDFQAAYRHVLNRGGICQEVGDAALIVAYWEY